LAAGFEEGFAVLWIVIEGDELLAGAEEEFEDGEAIGGVLLCFDELFRIADDAAHGKALAGGRGGIAGGGEGLVEFGDGSGGPQW